MAYRVNITDEALADLQDIFEFIRRGSPQNAATMTQRILDAIDTLDAMPSRFKVVGRSRRTGSAVHSLLVRPFLIYYRVEEDLKTVFVLTIRHGSRLQPRHFP